MTVTNPKKTLPISDPRGLSTRLQAGPGWVLLALIPLLLLSTGLGMRMLDADMFWWDELLSLRFAGGAQFGPLTAVEVLARLIEESPWDAPLYHLALNGWGALVGWSVFATRALSLLVGLLAVAWSYRLGTALGGRPVGVASAWVMGLSAVAILYFHELRAYILYVLLVICCLWAYWHLISVPRVRAGSVGLLLAAVTGLLYTNYFAAVVLLPIGLYHLLWVPKNRRWWLVSGVVMGAGLLFAPYLAYGVLSAVQTVFTDTGWWRRLNLETSEIAAHMLYGFTNGAAPFALLLIPAAWLARDRAGLRLAWFVLMFMLVFSIGLNAFIPFIKHLRHILMIWPLLAVLFGAGLVQLAQMRGGRSVAVLAALAWGGLGIYHSATVGFHDALFRDEHLAFFRPHLPLNDLGRTLTAEVSAGDAVIFDAPAEGWALSGTFEYYLDPLPVSFAMTDWLPGDASDYTSQARGFLSDHLRVWYGVEQNISPGFRQASFDSLLAADYVQCRTALDYPDLRLDLYARAPVCCEPPAGPPLVTYPNGVALLAYSLHPAAAGDGVEVLAAWEVPPSIPANTYSVAWHILDAAGELVAQADEPLTPGGFGCQQALVLPFELAEDDSLHVIVYNWASGQRLSGSVADSSAPDEVIPLGGLDIAAE